VIPQDVVHPRGGDHYPRFAFSTPVEAMAKFNENALKFLSFKHCQIKAQQ
jgi:hypothetical protein